MNINATLRRPGGRSLALTIFAALVIAANLFLQPFGSFDTGRRSSASSTYFALSGGAYSFNLTPATTGLITSNNNWTNVPSMEGYFGQNLTATHGVDPQTVLGTEFVGNALPSNPRNVAANKGNPNAFNAGGVAEFDSGTYISLGLQGNTQANPYLVVYVNTVGMNNVAISYDLTDIDNGSNDAVSMVALQYRIGNSGSFTNLPAGYVADATQGPNIAGLVTSKLVSLPAAAWNQSEVQVRFITTNAADSLGASTPDEWIGVNNIAITALAPTAAQVSVTGRVFGEDGRALGGAIVTLTDEFGAARQSLTNHFGYYRLTNITAGNTYIMGVFSKRCVFDVQAVTVLDDLQDINFYPAGISGKSTESIK